ncbi:unnamed protein product [Peronospora belbahrii]|uniref:Uncharacterized protein n=1 Tax=Peronospora belbahrii TaxID=622444 RepID=A0AAU9L2P5_9STRA|nr:unnamed protein product [Peronospora belbahrii]
MAGVLNATLVIDTAQQMAKGQKKEIQEHSLVQSVANEQQTRRSLLVVVILADGMDVCGYQCIPTAGAWTGNVLKSVPDKVTLQPIATSKHYYELEDCLAEFDRDWTKCQEQVKKLKQCNDRVTKLRQAQDAATNSHGNH